MFWLLLLVASACQSPSAAPGEPGVPPPSATPRVGGSAAIVHTVRLLSPLDMINSLQNADAIVGDALYETLYKQVNDRGEIGPWLASKTEISVDGLVWTLTLQSGVKFHDGTDFDAAAVKANLDMRKASKTFALRAVLDPVKEVRVVDRMTVQILLSTPAASLRTALAGTVFGIQSPTAMAKYPDKLEYSRNAAGTGPFRLQGIPSTESIVFQRNEQYWGPKPYLDRVVYGYITDDAARVLALEAGDVHFGTVPGTEIGRIQREGKIDLILAPPPSPQMLFMNIGRSPLKDQRVRSAIAYALNRATYVAAFGGNAAVSESVVGTSLFGYAPQSPYPYDPTMARQLLAAAGIKNEGTPLKLIILNDEQQVIAQLVKQDLDRVGLRVTIERMDRASWGAAILAPAAQSTWDLSVTAIGIPYADGAAPLLRLFLSTSSDNWSHYKNVQVDSLLREQATAADPVARAGLLGEVQKIIRDELPVYPLIAVTSAYGHAKSLHGVQMVSGGTLPRLHKAWLAQ